MEIDPQCMPAPRRLQAPHRLHRPRPIAWVSRVGADGVNNLAPFSFFMGVCNDPPTLAFSAGPRSKAAGTRTAGPKDTVRNLEATGDWAERRGLAYASYQELAVVAYLKNLIMSLILDLFH